MIDWFDMGCKAAIIDLEGSKTPVTYPTQDFFTKEDETMFIAGYNYVMKNKDTVIVNMEVANG